MTRYAEVQHREWIHAPVATVRSQFADLEHHIRTNVHPKLRFELLTQGADHARFVQEVRLLGLRQRDVFERRIDADGSICDRSVEGFNKGGSLSFRFVPERNQEREGTRVDITIRLPMPGPLALLRPLLEAQIRREVRAAALEDRRDIEERGYAATADAGSFGMAA